MGLGADTQITNNQDYTPLDIACQEGYIDIVTLLLPYTSSQNVIYQNALNLACQEGHTAIVQLLIEHIETHYLKNNVLAYHETASNIAFYNKHTPQNTIQLLTHFLANLKSKYQRALEIACYHGHMDIVKLLIKYDAPISKQALEAACQKGHKDIVTLLINYGGDVPLNEVLKAACQGGNIHIVELLMEHGVSIKNNAEALWQACHSGHIHIVKLFIKYGADIHAQGDLGRTALHGACSVGRRDIIDVLVEHGADVNATDSRNNTPLHYAAYDKKTMECLILHGAQVNICNHYNNTPSDRALPSCKQLIDTTNTIDKNFTSKEASATVKLLQRFIACNVHSDHIKERFLACDAQVKKILFKHALIHNENLCKDFIALLAKKHTHSSIFFDQENLGNFSSYLQEKLDSYIYTQSQLSE